MQEGVDSRGIVYEDGGCPGGFRETSKMLSVLVSSRYGRHPLTIEPRVDGASVFDVGVLTCVEDPHDRLMVRLETKVGHVVPGPVTCLETSLSRPLSKVLPDLSRASGRYSCGE